MRPRQSHHTSKHLGAVPRRCKIIEYVREKYRITPAGVGEKITQPPALSALQHSDATRALLDGDCFVPTRAFPARRQTRKHVVMGRSVYLLESSAVLCLICLCEGRGAPAWKFDDFLFASRTASIPNSTVQPFLFPRWIGNKIRQSAVDALVLGPNRRIKP